MPSSPKVVASLSIILLSAAADNNSDVMAWGNPKPLTVVNKYYGLFCSYQII